MKLPLPKINKILFLMLLFVYIYAPPFKFIPIGINKLIAPIALLGLLFCFKGATLKVLLQKHLFIAICLTVVSIIYAVAIDTTLPTNNVPFAQKNSFGQAMILIELLPITLFICTYGIRKLKLTLADFLSSFVTVAAIQSFIAFAMLLLPGLRMFILTTILNYDANKDKIFRPDLYIFRSFGMSQDLLFSLAIVQGIAVACILSLCLYNFSKYKYSLLLIPLLLLSIAINARIGLITIIMFILVTMLFALLKLRIHLLSRFLVFSSVSVLIIYLFIGNANYLLELDIEQNIKWASEAFVQGKNFAQGSQTDIGNFGAIKDRFWHLPENESARMFGEGKYVFRDDKISKKSDVGYVRKIYFGGYIYSFFSYSALIYLFIGSQKKNHQEAFKPLFYSILLSALVAQLKGDIFVPVPGFRIIFLIFIFAISERRLSKPRSPQIDNKFIYSNSYELHQVKS